MANSPPQKDKPIRVKVIALHPETVTLEVGYGRQSQTFILAEGLTLCLSLEEKHHDT